MRAGVVAACVGMLTLGTGGAAAAATLTTDEALREFNVIVFGDLALAHDIEGRVFVGGALSGNGEVGTRSLPSSRFDALTVGGRDLGGSALTGSVLSGNIKIANGGSTSVDGSGEGVLELNAGPSGSGVGRFSGAFTGTANQGTILQGVGVTVPDLLSLIGTVRDTSATLAGIPGAAPTIVGNRVTFEGAAADGFGRAIYAVRAADLPQNGELNVILVAGQTAIVNVIGDVDFAARNIKTLGDVTDGNRIVYNMVDATDVILGGGSFIGSVVAPFANVTNSTPIEGSLIALSATQGGQYHLRSFDGMVTTPLPAGGVLLAFGLGALAALRRRHST